MQQSQLECIVHSHHLKNNIINFIKDNFKDELNNCIEQYKQYCSQDYWDSKNERLAKTVEMDLETVFAKLLANIVMIANNELPLINILTTMDFGFDSYKNIQTVAEMLYVLNEYDWFWITMNSENTRYIQSNIALNQELQNRIQLTCVLPPMIVRPSKLTRNNSCGFRTIHKDSLILGFKENYHNECISLDVLNILNSTRYELDKEIVYKFEKEFVELNKDEFDALDEVEQEIYLTQQQTYYNCKEQFEFFRDVIGNNEIYFTHKVDKRGRVYSQGYQFNVQGSSYEKACLNLKTREYVIGEL